MRNVKRILVLGLALGLANVTLTASPAFAAGGPVVLMGIDAEDGGVNGHGPTSVYSSVVTNGILNNTTNGGTGMLVIGGGKAADQVTAFWNNVSGATGSPVTYVNGAAAIGTQSFAGFEMLAVVSSQPGTPSGGLTQAENNALATRQADIATFVNTGGGLFGSSQSGLTGPYGYLTGVGGFTFNLNQSYGNITPTPAGTAVGITDALDVSFWHDTYLTFPSFLTVLATNAANGQAAAIGGATVVVPTAISLTPATATNPIGSPHTVTATVLDNVGLPLPGTLVAFTVSGANAGATGTCVPPTCQTDANGQVTFTYTGTNVGNDTITACFTDQGGSMVCSSANKTWFSPVTISINDISVNEGDAGLTPATFTVSLSQPALAGGVTVLASTANGSAAAPGDYQSQTNTLVSFAAGETTKPFTVQVVGDVVNEPNETFVVNLSGATGGTIADPQGVGTIVDDDRNGAFSCRASALRVTGLLTTEPAVANAANSPCVDGAAAVSNANVGSGAVSVSARTLFATTDQTPNNLESTAPAATDNAVARAGVERATVGALFLINISANAVQAEAKVQCTASGGGLVPTFATSSSIGSLSINGIAVNVNATGVINLPAGLGTIELNQTTTTATSVTRRAIRIMLLGQEIVIGEARANFSGNPCAQ